MRHRQQLSFFDVSAFQDTIVEKPGCKKCIKCGEIKPYHMFNPDRGGTKFDQGWGRRNACSKCLNAQDKIRKNFRKNNPEPPPGPCPICGKHTERFVIDHCHETGKIRDWICRKCNSGMGQFSDDLVSMKKAVAYLEKYQE